MAHSRRSKVCAPLLQQELDRVVDRLPSLGRVELPLKLAMHRLHFLTWQERLLLLEQISEKQDFLSLGLAEIEGFLYRSIRTQSLDMAKVWEYAERDAEFLARRGVRYVSVVDREYPSLLREIHRAPFGLFVRGAASALLSPMVTMVGTRAPTWSGVRAAERLAEAASDAGICVVSGLARGIDAAAHRGALQRRGAGTVAVLPCGSDRVYPPSNLSLAAAIIERGGCLATEYPPGVSLDRYRFPERNRILAGISRLTVVVEAPAKSGALITSDLALSEGRDVAVAADCMGSSRNAGADALAREGACAVRSGEDMLALLEGRGVWDWGIEIERRGQPRSKES